MLKEAEPKTRIIQKFDENILEGLVKVSSRPPVRTVEAVETPPTGQPRRDDTPANGAASNEQARRL